MKKRRIITIEAPTEDASVRLADAELIRLYNLNLTNKGQNPLFDITITTLRNELINRDIITEEHEGDVVS
jgi:hypothetical protein